MPTELPPRPDDLPEFENPPLVEVALTSGFSPLLAMRQAHIGAVWMALRDEYPTVRDQPALDEMGGDDGLRITFSSDPRIHRAWFLGPNGDRLIQIQDDRFVANWRIHGDDPYPRFRELYPQFVRARQTFIDELGNLGLQPPRHEIVEVVYVNWIDAQKPEDFMVSLTKWPSNEETEVIRHDLRLRLTVGVMHPGTPPAEVVVQVDPGRAPEGHSTPGKPGWLMQLIFRAPVPGPDAELQGQQYWEGRNAIVRTFTMLTTPEAQTRWGRTR